MSDARETLRAGDVRGTLDLLKAEVRRAPRDAQLRTFLFQMFCISGEWDRALTQLKVAGELDPKADAMVTTYRAAIRCELLREKIFRGERTPTVFGDPGDWVGLVIEAARLLATGQNAQAAALREEAFERAPTAPVDLDGTASDWLADADPRLGPLLEAVVEGRYMWIPWIRIKRLSLDPPADLRDQVWMPARCTWTNDGEAVALIPTRYPGSAASADPLVQLARKTDWQELDDDWALPVGQRMLLTQAGETALMDLRSVTTAQATADAPAAESVA